MCSKIPSALKNCCRNCCKTEEKTPALFRIYLSKRKTPAQKKESLVQGSLWFITISRYLLGIVILVLHVILTCIDFFLMHF
jgi:hypothetical protein